MNDELKEYQSALQANLDASKNELLAKETKRRAYHRLMTAKEQLRAKEKELMEDCEMSLMLI